VNSAGTLKRHGARWRPLLLSAAAIIGAATSFAVPGFAQRDALSEMVGTERRFAARALVVGWKQAFLEYFADSAAGFDGDQIAPAKELFRKRPDPPRGLQLIWEPRYGDVSSGGDLGYLTGPVRRVNPAVNNGHPAYSIYASVWKRHANGEFRVVMDMGVPTPGPVTFPDGFTRAPHTEGYARKTTTDSATKSLRDTDAALTNALRRGQSDAYRGHLGTSARLHRPDVMPLVGEPAILQWLKGQPRYATGESRFAETSIAGDLGYTYGTYALEGGQRMRGSYVRVWTRKRDGVWRVVLDVLQ
jgi:ketosteroid isomerase-like protein